MTPDVLSTPKKTFLSFLPFLFVLITLSIGFTLWFRSRPTYLLYQLRKEMSQGHSSSVVMRYKHLLQKKDLSREDEILLRRMLADFYLDALGEKTTLVVQGGQTGYSVTPTFLVEAKAEVKRVLELDPNDGHAHFLMGKIFLMEGLDNFAREELSTCQKLLPKDPRPLSILSFMSTDRGDAETGKSQAQQALAIDPQFGLAQKGLINAEVSLGEFTAALAQIDKLPTEIRLSSDLLAQRIGILARQNNWTQAERELTEAESLFPQNYDIVLAHAKFKMARKNYEEAFALFAQASNLQPRVVWPMMGMIEAASAQKECQRIEPLVQMISEGLPRWPGSYVLLADLSLCRGESASALTYLNQALSFSPEYDEAIRRKAQLCLDLERYDELGHLLRPLLDKKVHQTLAYTFLAKSFLQQGNKVMSDDMAANIPVIEGHEMTDPAELALNDGQNALRDKKFNEASRYFLQALQGKPYLLRAHIGLIEARWELHDTAGARQELSSAMKLNSNSDAVQRWRRKIG